MEKLENDALLKGVDRLKDRVAVITGARLQSTETRPEAECRLCAKAEEAASASYTARRQV